MASKRLHAPGVPNQIVASLVLWEATYRGATRRYRKIAKGVQGKATSGPGRASLVPRTQAGWRPQERHGSLAGLAGKRRNHTTRCGGAPGIPAAAAHSQLSNGHQTTETPQQLLSAFSICCSVPPPCESCAALVLGLARLSRLSLSMPIPS